MPKKTRRSQRKTMTSRATQAATAQSQPAAVPLRPAASVKVVAPAKVDLAKEYDYVFADLRKIAIIAAAMFVLLFVLAFVLK